MVWLAWWVDGGDARRRWALAELLAAAGIAAREVDGPDAPRPGPLLVNGAPPPVPGALVIPLADDPPLAWDAALAGGVALGAAIAGDGLAVDVVRQVERLLVDAPHAAPAPADLDRHGRLTWAASAPARAGLGDVPIVDRTADAVGRWIEARTGIARVPRWPGGARAAVGLSHDVDHPDRYGIARAVARGPARIRTAPRTLLRKAWSEARARRRDPAPDEFWAFDALVASEARRGFTSTYHFASTPFYGEWGSPYDVAYDIGEARFGPVFASLREAGSEVALHTGYRAWEAPGRIAAERERLRHVSGAEVRGNRHHYWHMGPDVAATLREHEAAGFAWDASLAFNEHPGFRRSGTLPFHPWDPAAGRPLRTLQLPTSCMDGSLFYTSDDVDAGVAAVDAQLSTIEASGGSMVLDWHLQASVPTNREYRAWAEAYQAILDLCVARGGLWVTGLDAMERWWTERAATLSPRP